MKLKQNNNWVFLYICKSQIMVFAEVWMLLYLFIISFIALDKGIKEKNILIHQEKLQIEIPEIHKTTLKLLSSMFITCLDNPKPLLLWSLSFAAVERWSLLTKNLPGFLLIKILYLWMNEWMNELDTYIPPNIRLITRSLRDSHHWRFTAEFVGSLLTKILCLW